MKQASKRISWGRFRGLPSLVMLQLNHGTGSSPVCYYPVPSHFNMDECHVEAKKSKGQKISHEILSLISPFSPSLHLFSLFISLFKRTKLEHQSIRCIKTKEQRMWVLCLGFYQSRQEWLDWVPPNRRLSIRVRVVISHPPYTAVFSWLPLRK